MGTSISQGSPNTNPWRVVRAAYVNPKVHQSKLQALIWRAAGTSADAQLGKQLAGSIIAACARIVSQESNAVTAMQLISNVVRTSATPTIAIEIAARAAQLSYQTKNRPAAFVQALFAESTRYLVSRDAPSLIGLGDRLRTVRDVVALKASLSQQSASVASQRSLPERIDGKTWSAFVSAVLKDLAK